MKIKMSNRKKRDVKRTAYSEENAPPHVDNLLRTGDVARLLNIHANTVRRWSRNGILKAYRIGPRGDRRFVESEINRFFHEGV